ncbi:MAG: hypothetical protein V4555_02825 [Acidobacteriota bacterium]
MNLFNLHGKHFRNDENRLTANLAVLLNEARRRFMPAFLMRVGVRVRQQEIPNIKVALQQVRVHEDAVSILDATVTLGDRFSVVIESKVGRNSISPSQALKYGRWLASYGAGDRALVFITQLREPAIEQSVRSELQAAGINSVRCVFFLWRELFEVLRESEGLDDVGFKRCEQRIRKGLSVSSVERLSYLFLNEVEKMAFELSVVDQLAVGEVTDVVIQVQDEWFMRAALEHNVWFPPSQSIHGLKPAKYVAYYQTKDNRNGLPKYISHIARIVKVWKRVSYEDARSLPEFKDFFANAELASTVAKFKNKEGLFHIALTGKATALAHPIPLGNPSTAQFLAKKRFPFTRMLSAKTTDDLFAAKHTEPQDE